MENIKQKRLYSIFIDIIISNTLSTLVLSFFNFERDIQIGVFTLFGLNFKYGYSFLFVFLLIYFIIFDFLNKGQTFGKLIFSILVVNSDSFKQLSIKKRIQRTFFKMLSLMLFPISIIIFIQGKGLTLQDKMINTSTIKT